MGKRSRCAAYQMHISGAEEAALLRHALQEEGGRGKNRQWQLVVPVRSAPRPTLPVTAEERRPPAGTAPLARAGGPINAKANWGSG